MSAAQPQWRSPLERRRYDRDPVLTDAEHAALHALGKAVLHPWQHRRRGDHWAALARLLRPLDDAHAALSIPLADRDRLASIDAVGLVLLSCRDRRQTFWVWSDEQWIELIGRTVAEFRTVRTDRAIVGTIRPYVLALAYLLGGFDSLRELGPFNRVSLTWRIFGREVVDEEINRVGKILAGWGYHYYDDRRGTYDRSRLPTSLAHMMLVNRSPLLADLTTEAFDRLRGHPDMQGWQASGLHAFQRAVATLGHCDPPPVLATGVPEPMTGTPKPWGQLVERWFDTSTLSRKFRQHVRTDMRRAGRWLIDTHPEITEPGQWTRQTCVDWIAAVDRMLAGDYASKDRAHITVGKPLKASSKQNLLVSTRTFFHDLQEWEWIPRRFDPSRSLATPTSINALASAHSPRVIADEHWAKLIWAGLNLEPGDLPASRAGAPYPRELSRAICMTWLFAGLRSDEIARLPVGCIRWQRDDVPISGNAEDVLARDAVCLLDVPAGKSGTCYTKPVDPLLGQAIEAWEALRPEQPLILDRKTGDVVSYLFVYRAKRVAKAYINCTLIPALCRKAGVPESDSRGAITSHRARATIATQLYNAKEPMTLFELKEWLNHTRVESTQRYTAITPTRLAKAYSDAGYFTRNLRTVEVLVDRDAVTSGAAAAGEPWQFYDLGHGFCTYSFFEQCPHRMACAKCDFYTPKDSTAAQLLEARSNLQRMIAEIPLTDEERAAVEDGQAAVTRLLDRLADTPTPGGRTPREMTAAPNGILLPIVAVTNSGHVDATAP